MEDERKFKCVDGRRHYYRKIGGVCYKCSRTKEENGTKVGGCTTFMGRVQTKYEGNKKWRKTHPKLRYKGTTRYYKKHRKYNVRSNERYLCDDNQIILTKIYEKKLMIDVEIAKLLGRSLRAIQIQRTKLKKRRRKNE